MTRESVGLPFPASQVLTLLLATVVVVAPWPYGSVEAGWGLSLRSLVLVALILAIAFRSEALGSRERVAGTLGLVGVIGLLTALPWPRFLAEWLSPPVAKASAALTTELNGLPLSAAPSVSQQSALFWLGAAGTVLLASLVRRPAHRYFILAAALAGALAQVLPSLVWRAGPPIEALAFLAGGQGRYTGSFVNSNHFALFLVLAIAIAGAVGMGSFLYRGWRLPALLLGSSVTIAVLVNGILRTGSRSALAALSVVLFTQLLLAGWLGSRAKAPPVKILVPALVVGALIFATVIQGPVIERVAEASILRNLGPGFVPGRPYQENAEGRHLVAEATVDLWKRSPFLGSGLGSFRQAFPLVQPPGLRTNYWHAHNDFLELLATTGLLGVVLVSASLLSLLGILGKGLTRARSRSTKILCLAACGALAGAGVQSWFDFGLVVPSNSLLLAIICGLAMGSALGEGRRHRGHSASPERGEPIFPRRA